ILGRDRVALLVGNGDQSVPLFDGDFTRFFEALIQNRLGRFVIENQRSRSVHEEDGHGHATCQLPGQDDLDGLGGRHASPAASQPISSRAYRLIRYYVSGQPADFGFPRLEAALEVGYTLLVLSVVRGLSADSPSRKTPAASKLCSLALGDLPVGEHECWMQPQNPVSYGRFASVALHGSRSQPQMRKLLSGLPSGMNCGNSDCAEPIRIEAHLQEVCLDPRPRIGTDPSTKRGCRSDGSSRVSGCRGGRLSQLRQRQSFRTDADAHSGRERWLPRQRRARDARSRLCRREGERELSGQSTA